MFRTAFIHVDTDGFIHATWTKYHLPGLREDRANEHFERWREAAGEPLEFREVPLVEVEARHHAYGEVYVRHRANEADLSELITERMRAKTRPIKQQKAWELRQAEKENRRLEREERLREEYPVRSAYRGSDATFTRQVLRRLEACGPLGLVAAHLFRSQKSSSRAKQYRGDYVGYAYNRKSAVLDKLCHALAAQGEITWGWGRDDAPHVPEHVLYVDLPQGQVSFHAIQRCQGPDYRGEWDGQPGTSEKRIITFAEATLKEVKV